MTNLLIKITTSTFGGTTTFYPRKIKSCYSQSLGFWYGILTLLGNPPGSVCSLESPPAQCNCGSEHQIVGGGPITFFGTAPIAPHQISENFDWGRFIYTPDEYSVGVSEEYPVEAFNPPPPPNCDPEEENTCYFNGGTWNSDSCYCQL